MDLDLDLDLGDDLRMRALVKDDAALLVEATSGEPAPSLWGPRPVGPYSPHDAQAALSAWDPAAGGQFSIGILHGRRLLGAVGLMPDRPGSIELAYWIRPEDRGRGIASRAAQATTLWVHRNLAIPRIWLEIHPGNEPSLRLARRAGYHLEQRLSRHCRDWSCEDAGHDSWHDCLIWAHTSDQTPATAHQATREAGPGHSREQPPVPVDLADPEDRWACPVCRRADCAHVPSAAQSPLTTELSPVTK